MKHWDIHLKQGDPILDMHIPAGGKMGVEEAFRSFSLANYFFERLMPDIRHRAIVCHSWIFNPNMAEILLLPRTSSS